MQKISILQTMILAINIISTIAAFIASQFHPSVQASQQFMFSATLSFNSLFDQAMVSFPFHSKQLRSFVFSLFSIISAFTGFIVIGKFHSLGTHFRCRFLKFPIETFLASPKFIWEEVGVFKLFKIYQFHLTNMLLPFEVIPWSGMPKISSDGKRLPYFGSLVREWRMPPWWGKSHFVANLIVVWRCYHVFRFASQWLYSDRKSKF